MAASRRTRNYAAEEARRNAKARQLGFTSRAQMRRALRQGWTPQRRGGPRSAIVAPPPGEPMRPVAKGLTGVRRLRAESKAWSNIHSRKPTSRYRDSMTADQVRAFHAAYIADETRANKIENELYSLRDYLVDTMGFYTDETFDDRYGVTYIRNMVSQYGTPELSARLGNEAE